MQTKAFEIFGSSQQNRLQKQNEHWP